MEMGSYRTTVRKYRSLSDKGFHGWISRLRNLLKRLSVHYKYVKVVLELQLCLLSAQIEDLLMERYADLPAIHSKTI